MANPPETIGQPPLLGIPPKGIPPTDPRYRDLAARGKLPRDVFNVLSFGASADGNIDDTKAIQRAVDAASKAGGGAVYLPHGTYRITTGLVLYANVTLCGDGHASVLKWEGANTPPNMFTAMGTAGTEVILTANAAGTDDHVHVAAGSEANFEVGDYALIYSTEVFENDVSTKCGEIQQIESKSSGVLNLHDPLYDGYAVADTAKVRPLHMLENVTIRDLTIEGLYGSGTNEQGAFDFTQCHGVLLLGVRFNNIGRWSVVFTRCVDFHVVACEFNHSSPALQGYGVCVATSQNGTIMGNNFNEMRHAVTGGGAALGGASRMITIVGNTARDSKSVAFHNHGGAEFWNISNNVVIGGDEFGIGGRGTNQTIEGNIIKGAVGGIYLQSYSENRPNAYHVIGNKIYVAGKGIYIVPINGATTNNDGIIVQGNYVETYSNALLSPAIQVGDSDVAAVMRGVSVTGNEVRIYGYVDNNPFGIDLRNLVNVACVGNGVYHSGGYQTRPLYRFNGLIYFTVVGNTGIVESLDGAIHMDFNNCNKGSVTANSLANGTYGMDFDADCSNTAVVGNSIFSMSTGAINNAGAGMKIAHNIGDATHNE